MVLKIFFKKIVKFFFVDKYDVCYICIKVVDDIEIYNFYIFFGGDEFNWDKNEKFDYKLKFIIDVVVWFKKCKNKKENKFVFVGDLNVVFLENDVWFYK